VELVDNCLHLELWKRCGGSVSEISVMLPPHLFHDSIAVIHQIHSYADFLVNAIEDNLPKDAIIKFRNKVYCDRD